ncbi:response regulator transcription factor [Alteromonadaceae bacterium M269]|nr:response regulator transcription factor [Alteromonadaceae bacterium M269]
MTNKIRAIIVDDEPLARKGLAIRLSGIEDIDLIAEGHNGLQAVELIKEKKPDLVFLDIQMPGLNGFQVINRCKELDIPIPLIVFVTAYDSFAIKAFEIHALDYVLKPVDGQRLEEALTKVRQYTELHEESEHKSKLVELIAEFTGEDCEEVLRKLSENETITTNQKHYADILAIKDGSEVTRVPVVDIQWIDAAGDYMCVHTNNDTHIMRKTMKELEEQLDPKFFVRVHRSAIVNIKYVNKLISHISGEYHVALANGEELRVSRSYRDRVKEMVHQ